MAVLNREDKQNKHFYIYDIFNDKMIRKIRKLERPLRQGQDESDAFDIDLEGKVIIYASGDELLFKLVKIPDAI